MADEPEFLREYQQWWGIPACRCLGLSMQVLLSLQPHPAQRLTEAACDMHFIDILAGAHGWMPAIQSALTLQQVPRRTSSQSMCASINRFSVQMASEVARDIPRAFTFRNSRGRNEGVLMGGAGDCRCRMPGRRAAQQTAHCSS